MKLLLIYQFNDNINNNAITAVLPRSNRLQFLEQCVQ